MEKESLRRRGKLPNSDDSDGSYLPTYLWPLQKSTMSLYGSGSVTKRVLSILRSFFLYQVQCYSNSFSLVFHSHAVDDSRLQLKFDPLPTNTTFFLCLNIVCCNITLRCIHYKIRTYMGSSTFAAAVIVVAAAVFYLAFSTAISWYRLSKFPGPFMNSISYLPMLQTRLRQSSPKYAALAGKYGPIVRIGPNDLLTSSPDHIRKMSAVRSTYGRSSWYKATRLDPYHDMMGSVLDKAGHHSLRTKMVAGYSGKDDPNLGACLDSQIAALIKRIQISYLSTPSTKVPVDFGKLADYYAHDARGRMSFGKPLGMLEKNADVHGIIATVKIALNLIQIFTDIPPLQKIFLSNFVLKLVGPKPTDNWGVGKLMG